MKVHHIVVEADTPRLRPLPDGTVRITYPDGKIEIATDMDDARAKVGAADRAARTRADGRVEPRVGGAVDTSNTGARAEPRLGAPASVASAADDVAGAADAAGDAAEVRPVREILVDWTKWIRSKLPSFLAKMKLGGATALVGAVMDAIETNQMINEYVRMGQEAETKYAPQYGKGSGWNHPDVKAKKEETIDTLVSGTLTAIASIVVIPAGGALATAGTAAAAASLGFGPPGWVIGGAAWLLGMGAAYLGTRAAVRAAVENMEEIGIGAYIQDWLYNEIFDNNVLISFSYSGDIVSGTVDAAKALVGVESVQESNTQVPDFNARMKAAIKADPNKLAAYKKGISVAKTANKKPKSN